MISDFKIFESFRIVSEMGLFTSKFKKKKKRTRNPSEKRVRFLLDEVKNFSKTEIKSSFQDTEDKRIISGIDDSLREMAIKEEDKRVWDWPTLPAYKKTTCLILS